MRAAPVEELVPGPQGTWQRLLWRLRGRP